MQLKQYSTTARPSPKAKKETQKQLLECSPHGLTALDLLPGYTSTHAKINQLSWAWWCVCNPSTWEAKAEEFKTILGDTARRWGRRWGRKGKNREAAGRRRGREEGMAEVVVFHLVSAVDRFIRTNEDFRL